MAEENVGEAQQVEEHEFVPITSQEQLVKVIGERVERARNKVRSEFADYDDLKAKAAELDQIREAQKTELERANDRAAAAEAERDALKAERQASQWAQAASEKYGVPASLLRGETQEEVEAHAKAISELAKPKPPVVRNDGGRAQTPETGDWLGDLLRRS